MKTNVMYARRIAEVGHPGDHVMTVHEGILSIVAFVPLDSRSALRVPHGGFRSSLRSRSTPPAPQLRLHSSPKVGLASNASNCNIISFPMLNIIGPVIFLLLNMFQILAQGIIIFL